MSTSRSNSSESDQTDPVSWAIERRLGWREDRTVHAMSCTRYLAALGAAAVVVSSECGGYLAVGAEFLRSRSHHAVPDERRDPLLRAFTDAVREVMTAG
jgi:hypothetical protein